MDVLYARCPESLIDDALGDAHQSDLLANGHGAVEQMDLGRDQHRLYHLLGPGEEFLSQEGAQDHWAGLALAGDGFFPLSPNLGYGKARFLRPAKVAEIARRLEALPDDAIGDPKLLSRVRTMRAFYSNAARDGHAVVVAFW
jgi:hypothetical protein